MISGCVNVLTFSRPCSGWAKLNSAFTEGIAWTLWSPGSLLTIRMPDDRKH
jgi:hypothetical protein